MPVVLAGLDETVLKDYRHTYEDYARYRRLPSGEAALRELISKHYARAKKLVEGYLVHLRDQGLSEGYINCQKSHLIMAVDQAEREGMTGLNFPRRRDSKPNQSEELLPLVAKDLTAIGERNLRSGLRDYARYRGLKDGEAALRELISKDYAPAKKLVEGYVADMAAYPRLFPSRRSRKGCRFSSVQSTSFASPGRRSWFLTSIGPRSFGRSGGKWLARQA